MPKSEWIVKKEKNTGWFCPWCGELALRVCIGSERQGTNRVRVAYLECYHKNKLANPERFDFPNKFKIYELQRFPRKVKSEKEWQKEIAKKGGL